MCSPYFLLNRSTLAIKQTHNETMERTLLGCEAMLTRSLSNTGKGSSYFSFPIDVFCLISWKIRVLARDKGRNETTLPLTPEKCIFFGSHHIVSAILVRQKGDSIRGTRLINVNNWKCMVAADVSGQDESLQKSHKKNASKHPKHRGGTIWSLPLLASEKLEWCWVQSWPHWRVVDCTNKGHEWRTFCTKREPPS